MAAHPIGSPAAPAAPLATSRVAVAAPTIVSPHPILTSNFAAIFFSVLPFPSLSICAGINREFYHHFVTSEQWGNLLAKAHEELPNNRKASIELWMKSKRVEDYIACLPADLQRKLPPAAALDRAQRYLLLLALIRANASACYPRLSTFIHERFQDGIEILFEARQANIDTDIDTNIALPYPDTLFPYFTELTWIIDDTTVTDPTIIIPLLREFQRVADELVQLNLQRDANSSCRTTVGQFLRRMCTLRESEAVVKATCQFILATKMETDTIDLLGHAIQQRNAGIYHIFLLLVQPCQIKFIVPRVAFNPCFSGAEQMAVIKSLFKSYPQECFDELAVTTCAQHWLEECFKEGSGIPPSQIQQMVLAKLDTPDVNIHLFHFLCGKLDPFKRLLDQAKAVGGEALVEEIWRHSHPSRWPRLKSLLTDRAHPATHPLLTNPQEVMNLLKGWTA